MRIRVHAFNPQYLGSRASLHPILRKSDILWALSGIIDYLTLLYSSTKKKKIMMSELAGILDALIGPPGGPLTWGPRAAPAWTRQREAEGPMVGMCG